MDPATIATIISTTRTVVKYGTQVFDYIRDDQTAKLGLLRPVRIVVEGPGVGIGNFEAPDGLFSITSPTINRVELDHLPFPADEFSQWNGPDGLPNTWKGGVLPASLPHDKICTWIKEIAAKLGLTEDEVWVWASGILSTVWEFYGGSTPQAKTESWFAYYITRNVRRPYKWIKRRLGFSSILILALVSTGCSGCLDPRPDWHVTHADPVISVEAGIVTTNTPPVIQ